MSDTATAAAETASAEGDQQQQQQQVTWESVSEEFGLDPAKAREKLTHSRKWEQRAKENAQAVERLAQIEESQKTAEQKLVERAETAERRVPDLERENLTLRVAITKQLPADLIDRLRGETEEELSADADSLLAMVAQPTTVPAPRPDLSQGAKSDKGNADPATDFANFIKGKLT